MFKLGQDHRIAPSRCTSCGDTLDGAASIGEDSRPSPGDVTLCLNCGHLMAFDEELRLRDLTPAQQVEIAGDPRILMGQRVRAILDKRKKRKR